MRLCMCVCVFTEHQILLGTTRGSGMENGLGQRYRETSGGTSREFSRRCSQITRAQSQNIARGLYCCKTDDSQGFLATQRFKRVSSQQRSPRQHNWTPVGRGTEPRRNDWRGERKDLRERGVRGPRKDGRQALGPNTVPRPLCTSLSLYARECN